MNLHDKHLRASDIFYENVASVLHLPDNSTKFLNNLLSYLYPFRLVMLEYSLTKKDPITIRGVFDKRNNTKNFFQLRKELRFFPLEILQSEPWKGLIYFCKSLKNNLDFFEYVWLEFDEIASAENVFIPNFFFGQPLNSSKVEKIIETIEIVTQERLEENVIVNIAELVFQFNLAEIGACLGKKKSSIRYDVVIDVSDIFYYVNGLCLVLPHAMLMIIHKVQKYISSKIKLNLEVSANGIIVQGIEIVACNYNKMNCNPHLWNELVRELYVNEWCEVSIANHILDWHFFPIELDREESKENLTSFPPYSHVYPAYSHRYIESIKLEFVDEKKKTTAYLAENYYWHRYY
jgi:hypothetical protein